MRKTSKQIYSKSSHLKQRHLLAILKNFKALSIDGAEFG
jgi:hypothetical protein